MTNHCINIIHNYTRKEVNHQYIMERSIKIKVHLSYDQERYCNQVFGMLRFIHNLYIDYNMKLYKKDGSFCTAYDFAKLWNHILRPNWAKELKCTKAVSDALITAEKAYKRFFKGISSYPRFKSKHRNPVQSFFFIKDNIRLSEDHSHVWIPCLHWIKLREKDYLKEDMIPYISSGRIIKNSGGYFIVFHLRDYPSTPKIIHTTSMNGIGIDLNTSKYMVISNVFGVFNYANNPIHYKKYKMISEKINDLNEIISHKVKCNFINHGYDISHGYPPNSILKKGEHTEIYNSHGILKLRKRINKLYHQQSCIMEDFIKKMCVMLVRAKPMYICIEDLNIQDMIKSNPNPEHRNHVLHSRFYKFRSFLTWKCLQYGIELRVADEFYPSSKKCCRCGHKKKTLSESTRKYICEKCGLKLDRDINAAINLAKCKNFTLAV